MNTILSVKEFKRYMELSERLRDKMLRGRATTDECFEYDRIRCMLRKFIDNQYNPAWEK